MPAALHLFLPLVHLGQAGLAAYGARQFYVIMHCLLTYRKPKEYARQSVPLLVEPKLRKTEATKRAGAASVVLSLLVALCLAFFAPGDGNKTGHYGYAQLFTRYAASPLMACAVWAARRVIVANWAKADGETVGPRLPGPKMEDYNEAQRRAETLLWVLQRLLLSWIVTSVLAAAVGY